MIQSNKDKLKALYNNYENIRVAMLGADYETRRDLKELKEKVAIAIKELESAKL